MFNCKKLKKHSLIFSLFIVLTPIYITHAQTKGDWAKGIARSLINCPLQDTIYVDMNIDPQRAHSYCCAKVKDKRTGEEKEIVISSDHPEHPKNFPCEYRGSYVCIVKYDKPQKPMTDFQKRIQEMQQMQNLQQGQVEDGGLQSYPSSLNFVNKILSIFNIHLRSRNIEKTSLLAAAGESSGCTERDDFASGSISKSQNSITPGTAPTQTPKPEPSNHFVKDEIANTCTANDCSLPGSAGTPPTAKKPHISGMPKPTPQTPTQPPKNQSVHPHIPNGTPQVPESMIKRGKAPEVDPRYAFVYGNNNTQATPQNVHPKGYESGDKYIVPIMRQYMETVESSFKGRLTAFDDIIYTEDELRAK